MDIRILGMTMQTFSIIWAIFSLIFNLVMGIIAFLIKNAIDNNKSKMEEINKSVKELMEYIVKIEKDIALNYVRKEDFSNNQDAHKEIWIEFRTMKEQIGRIDERLKSTEERP